jgi:hypothetical protein
MERSLRQKQSPNWLGDGFTPFAMTIPAVRWSQSIRHDRNQQFGVIYLQVSILKDVIKKGNQWKLIQAMIPLQRGIFFTHQFISSNQFSPA